MNFTMKSFLVFEVPCTHEYETFKMETVHIKVTIAQLYMKVYGTCGQDTEGFL